MILGLSYYGDPILRKKAKPVTTIDDEIRKLAEDMLATMDENYGIGLAAPQVGKGIRLFILRNYEEKEDGEIVLTTPQVFINPKITIVGKETQTDTEGCLSIPGIRADVSRPLKIIVEATDLNGTRFTEEVEGYKARVILHENDHIDGVLFIERIDPKKRKELEPVLSEIRKQYYEKK